MLIRIMLAGILVTGAAWAQGRGGGSRNNSPEMPSAPSRPNRLETLSQMLSLSKDQKKDVKNLMDEGQKAATPLRDQMAKAHAQVAAAVEEGKSQDEVNQAIHAYAELQAQMAAIELRAFTGVIKDLDNGQQQHAAGLYQMMNGIFKGKNWMEAE